jgi:hypothetical protein
MKAWFEIDLWKRVILGLVLGAAIGLGLRYGIGPDRAGRNRHDLVQAGGRRLHQPHPDAGRSADLLDTGLRRAGDGRSETLGSLGGRALAMYMVTTVIAVCFGLAMGTLLQPGAGFDLSVVSATDMDPGARTLAANPAPGGVVEQIIRTLLSIIPVNPVAAMAKGDVLAIIFFAIMLGIATLMAGEAGEPVARVHEQRRRSDDEADDHHHGSCPDRRARADGLGARHTRLRRAEVLGKMTLAHYLACTLHMLITYGLHREGYSAPAADPVLPRRRRSAGRGVLDIVIERHPAGDDDRREQESRHRQADRLFRAAAGRHHQHGRHSTVSGPDRPVRRAGPRHQR